MRLSSRCKQRFLRKIFFSSNVKVFKTSTNYLFVCTCKRDICHKLCSHTNHCCCNFDVMLPWNSTCCLPVCKNLLFYFLTCFQTLFVASTNCFSAAKQKWTYYACSEFYFIFSSGTLLSFNDLLVVWCTFLSVCNWTMRTEIFCQALSCGQDKHGGGGWVGDICVEKYCVVRGHGLW